MLRDGSNSRRVVGACVDGRHSVVTRGETVGNSGAKDAIDGNIVQTLEEREDGRVKDLVGVEVAHLLNDDAAGSDAHQG